MARRSGARKPVQQVPGPSRTRAPGRTCAPRTVYMSFGTGDARRAGAYARSMRRRIVALCLGLLACDRSPTPTPSPVSETTKKTATEEPPAMPVTPPAGSGRTSNLKADEEARVFPALGKLDGDAWALRVHAQVYEPELDSAGRGAAIEALRKALELPADAPESDIFRARARGFLVDNESMKSLLVRIGGAEYELASTGFDGHTHTDLRIPAAGLTPGPGGVLAIDVIPREHDQRHFGGLALLLPDTGVSVISDIDDTVKISEVRDKQKLLINTFLREPAPVVGMADAYRRWAAAGAAFHYVSASPWQLYDPLDGFFKASGFPQGSVHLKQFRVADRSFFSLFEDPIGYKTPIITGLLTRFPERRFVLVGDSGELDPEVYGDIYRKFPGQVVSIHIRDVTGDARESPRYAAAFADVPAGRWTLFTDPATLPASLQ